MSGRGPAATLAATFRKRRDYQVDREHGRIAFTTTAMPKLKAAVGWREVPSPAAVTMAEHVEGVIAGRERVDRSDGRVVLADVSVHGYLHSYRTVTCVAPADSRPGATFDEIVLSGLGTMWQRRDLAFDQLIDHYRAEVYAYRDRVRDETDPLRLVGRS